MTLTKLLCFTCIIGIKNLSVDQSSNTTSVQLSWSTLPSVSLDSYSYEVGFAVISSDRDCSSIMLDTLPQNYTSYYTNTTSISFLVTDLMFCTCYAFGVRVHSSSATSVPGQWTLQVLQIEGNSINFYINFVKML